jgi:hypothetical protein
MQYDCTIQADFVTWRSVCTYHVLGTTPTDGFKSHDNQTHCWRERGSHAAQEACLLAASRKRQIRTTRRDPARISTISVVSSQPTRLREDDRSVSIYSCIDYPGTPSLLRLPNSYSNRSSIYILSSQYGKERRTDSLSSHDVSFVLHHGLLLNHW